MTDHKTDVEKSSSNLDLFISYSRKDKDFVQKLYNSLLSVGKNVWVDWQDIPPSAEWEDELQIAIRESNSFVFVISPDSASSSVCKEEIRHAISNNKRIIPVVWRDTPPDKLLPDIRKYNWIFFRDQDDFNTGFQALITALETDLVYLRTHTRLQIRAVEWESLGKSNNLTLRGEDLDSAEAFLAEGENTEPYPTALQIDFITTSRHMQTRSRRRILAGVSIAIIIALSLAIVAFSQFQLAATREEARSTQQAIAEDNEAEAVANELARATAQVHADAQTQIVLARQIAAGRLQRSV